MYSTVFLIVQTIILAANSYFYSELTILQLTLLSIVNFFLFYLIFKQIVAFQYQRFTGKPDAHLKVAVVISFYNEIPGILRKSIESVLNQTVKCSELYIYDDGSESDNTYKIIQKEYESDHIHYKRFEKNRGKRYTQVDMFKRINSDIFITLDSDTILDESAVEEGLKPFNDPQIFGVSGQIKAYNIKSGLIAKFYGNLLTKSFTFERASQSVLDSVLVATGMFSMYRTSVLEGRFEHYLNMSSAGLNMSADDKRLTTYGINKGRVVQQMTAQAQTLVPELVSGFFKQQVRWARGFFSESFYSLKSFSKKRWVWWLSLFDISMWFLLPVSLFMSIFFLKEILVVNLVFYQVIYICILLGNQSKSNESIIEILIIPVLKILHIIILFPIRIIAISTIKSPNWLTREPGN